MSNLFDKNPDLVRIWDWSNNAHVDPHKVSAGSAKEVHWRCELGHSYFRQIRLAASEKSQGCPYCAGIRVLPGFNDFESKRPAEAKLYSPKNTVAVNDIYFLSKTQRLWICPLGHEWQARPKDIAHGLLCPYCEGRRTLPGFNDLQTLYPEVAPFLSSNSFDPAAYMPASTEKVKLSCPLGHSWVREFNVILRITECPYCTDNEVWPGYNDLRTLEPDLCRELDTGHDKQKDPTKVLGRNSRVQLRWRCDAGHYTTQNLDYRKLVGCSKCKRGKTNLRVSEVPNLANEWDKTNNEDSPTQTRVMSVNPATWSCSKGHNWEATPFTRFTTGSLCPYCAGKRVWPGFNDLKTLRPELAAEWNYKRNFPASPEKISPGDNSKFWWSCSKGHEWEAVVNNRTRGRNGKGTGCPYCQNRKVMPGFNDLATTHPELLSSWDFKKNKVLPSEVFFGQKDPAYWVCEKEHSTFLPPRTRIRRGTSSPSKCAYCANQKVLPGYNDLETLRPDLVSEYSAKNDPSPSEVLLGSGEKVLWECGEGHSYLTSPLARSRARVCCPTCLNTEFLPGYNDLQTKHPDLASEFDAERNGISAAEVIFSGNKKYFWLCPRYGHSFVQSVRKRIDGQSCPICANLIVLPGFNDLYSQSPEVASSLDKNAHPDLDTTKICFISSKKLSWVCKKDTDHGSWVTAVHKRTDSGQGCPSCATSGFKDSLDGYLYLIYHPTWELYQVGISNVIEARIATHSRIGWETKEIKGPMPGSLARRLEAQILAWLRKNNQITKVTPELFGAFSGYTESWPRDEFEPQGLSQLLSYSSPSIPNNKQSRE